MDTLFCPLNVVPREIWEHIAFQMVFLDPTGRPSALLPLLSTCSFLHNTLRFHHNKSLYARIFSCMFDPDAARRRFGDRAVRTSNLASQLRLYWETLKHIRGGDIHSPQNVDYFWIAFFMLMENDGRNAVQLRQAGLGPFVENFVRSRLWEDAENGWPTESPINSLALWLMWCTTTSESLAMETPEARQQLISLVLPYIVMAFKYHSFQAPDNHFLLPLPEEWERDNLYSLHTAHGYYPLYRDASRTRFTRVHYGQIIHVCAPSITAAAKLLYFARREAMPLGIPPNMPVNRADAIARGITRGQTQEDIIEVNSHRGAKFLPPTDWGWKEKLTPEELTLEEMGIWTRSLKAASAAWDNDWERVAYCWDPWSQPELKGVLYTYGSLDGLWQGRMLVPEETGYLNMIVTRDYPPQFSEMSPFMSTWPVFMRLREHHCINPALPSMPGRNPNDDLDEGIRNGWFPSVELRESGGKVVIHDRDEDIHSEYETYVEGKPNSHNEDTCRTCIATKKSQEEDLQQRVQANQERSQHAEELPRHADYEDDFSMAGLGRDLTSNDSDDEEDSYESTCSGIQDIIFTGETDPAHGVAWGRFSFLGRVRSWDGLIALVRVPSDGRTALYRLYTIHHHEHRYLASSLTYAGHLMLHTPSPLAHNIHGLERCILSNAFCSSNSPHQYWPDVHDDDTTQTAVSSGTFDVNLGTIRRSLLTGDAQYLAQRSPESIGTRIGQGTCMPVVLTLELELVSQSSSVLPPTACASRTKIFSMQLRRNVEAVATAALAESEPVFRIYAGKLFDPESLTFLTDQLVTVSECSGLVLSVRPFDAAQAIGARLSEDPRAIDLRTCTVLPGEVSWEDQLTKESLVERTLRAGVHAKRTLLAGFTTVRDLGTEGAGDADIPLRKCLSGPTPLVPGPRYFCSNRAIVSTGSYGPKSNLYVNREGIDGVTGAEAADGKDECVRAVRRQIGAGADWIKVRYMQANYRFRSRASHTSRSLANASIPTFTEDETDAIIRTAHHYGVKVAAHATNRSTVRSLLSQGIDSIEHGFDIDSRVPIEPPPFHQTDTHVPMDKLFAKAIWVPTLAAYYTISQNQGDSEIWTRATRTFHSALESGLDNIACGGDTGVFAHGDNALEMQLMVRLGADWRHVLRWATLGGWRCVRSMAWEGDAGERRLQKIAELAEDPRVVGDNEVPFGLVRRGWAADLIATSGDLEEDFEQAVSKQSIVFVMKGGRIYKRDGKEVGFA
ncbi:hypothetical protein EW146_g1793 [Bondarzewia mesenterica]|uniref:Amidohydrolase-related domain-containing protein n=1 Tax=Bondarzewia mesenterica TaxID=1095465 RepID=A0A4S4M508_9AGAM|nr:hypothetical protein EW146_g1793 [Bondarzewia mesenterica]